MRADPDQLAVDAAGWRSPSPSWTGGRTGWPGTCAAAGRRGQRVALLFDDAAQAYVAMLAVLKAGAAYVPLDPGFPADRMAYIVERRRAGAVLSLSRLRGHARRDATAAWCAWTPPRLAARDAGPLTAAERGPRTDPLAYVIYTSGSTGRPKGVAVGHAEHLQLRPGGRGGVRHPRRRPDVPGDDDRVRLLRRGDLGALDGRSDARAEAAGVGAARRDLHAYLVAQRVTAMCCVPTLLATLEEDVPDLRFLLVSGEACPHDLILRWHRPGRRFLNVYGPTEATVTATWTAVDPDRAVTIGVPLPTYSSVILDPDDPSRALPRGEIGEIGIAGIGLAVGYVNRPDLTERAFVQDFLGIPGNPSGRIYRTGDLGRVNETGRDRVPRPDRPAGQDPRLPHRADRDRVGAAAGARRRAARGGHLRARARHARAGRLLQPADRAAASTRRRSARCCGSGCPRTWCRPTSSTSTRPDDAQGKADRKNLPAPTARVGAAGARARRAGRTDRDGLAALLGETLGLDQVSVDAHFFDDLGANSLLLARFSAGAHGHRPAAGVDAGDLPQPDRVGWPRCAAPSGGAPERQAPRADVVRVARRYVAVRRRAAAALPRRAASGGRCWSSGCSGYAAATGVVDV